MHPLAFEENKSAFTRYRTGERFQTGDKIRHAKDGRTGTLDEVLHDGEAFVTWDDGTYDTLKWEEIVKP